MKSKSVILIAGVLLIMLVLQLVFVSQTLKKTVNKQIAGEKTFGVPIPDRNALVEPPEKASGFQDPQIYAKAIILMDVKSSYVMYSKNAIEKVPIASTTKIMTAIVVLEDHFDKLNDVVTISYPMIAVEGSDIKLQVGEQITVENLLKGLLIMSGNDTAYAIATYFGGKDKFVSHMNDKVKNLGLIDTQLKDPAGLDDTGYSTAHDLAILATYAMRNDKFREIVKMSETSISSVNGNIIHELKSSNRLIKSDEQLYYPLATGIKTGFTYEAGHCLVSAANKNDHEILSVILNTNENTILASAKESKKLLEWGFNNWTWQ
ncbi:MAG: Serine-type D-Ala-D-Ala carboxypeptidase [Candidatus Berkelbacteria bacterium]|nr:Serine-type D-Ala-D-Ala carboxypeptidase [Candidatus Berkelbacteria bacterium]